MILEVTLQQQLGGQLIINRWNYIGSGSLGTLANQSIGLLTAMGAFYDDVTTHDFPADTVFKRIALLQSEECLFIQALCRNIYPSPDFYEVPYPAGVAGQVAGHALPPFVAYGLNTTRVTTAIRRGQKRIAGVPPAAQSDLGNVASTYLALLHDLAENMSATLTTSVSGSSLTFVPVILNKLKETDVDGNVTYKYYPVEADQVTHSYSGFTWIEKNTLRSQTSRQYGRGA